MKSLFNPRVHVCAALLFLTTLLSAQKGIVSGKVIDKASGEAIIGAIVLLLKDSTQVAGAATDLDGNYLLQASEGTYDVQVSYLSYAPFRISGFAVTNDEVANLDIPMQSSSVDLGEIVVKAEAIRTTEVALVALQRRAVAIQDGVSSQQISRTGSSTAADAIRQMPGAVVEGGRFVVVRGLGDRYSLSQMNGVTLPSTDPYRNASSMDLIPSKMIDNVISVKTFTPDLPGNFSGGLINIETKSIPDRFNLSLELNGSYNTQSSFNSNFLAAEESGKYDWLGFEDGTRAMPSIMEDPAVRDLMSSSTYLTARQPGNEAVTSVFHETSRALSNTFIPVNRSSPLNTGFNLSLGNRFKVFNNDLGFTAAINYGNTFQHYEGAKVSTWINTNSDFLFAYQDLTETKSVQNPSLGALLDVAYKIGQNHKIGANVIFNNDAELISREQVGSFLGQVSNSAAVFNTRSVEFLQRQMANYQLSGSHAMPKWGNVLIDWSASLSRSFQEEPDLKYFAYTTECTGNGGEMFCDYYMNNAEYAFPYHFFRRLDDKGGEARMDITIPFLTGREWTAGNNIKIGGLYNRLDRDFSEYRYQMNNSGVPSKIGFSQFGGDFDAFLDPANFGIIDTTYKADGSVNRYQTGYHYINQINAKNFYTGQQKVGALYAMVTYGLTPRLKLIGGVRMEATDISVVSQDTTVAPGMIKQTDFLYSLNAIYTLTERSNLRLAASQTLARPNMRELAPFVQFDTKNGFFNVGNPALKRTIIYNYDVRYEFYPASGELIALSGYLKVFNDPIIRAFNPRATIPELSFINVDQARVYGVELEVRKQLVFLTPAFRNLYLNTNLALIHSSYRIPEAEIENSTNIDPRYDQTTRPFQGQAPYIINAILSYIQPVSGWEVALAYNVSGQKLYNISLFATPDVYEQPISMLNLKVSKRVGDHFQVSLSARNLLDAVNRKTLDFKGQDYVAESFTIGRTFGVTLTCQIR